MAGIIVWPDQGLTHLLDFLLDELDTFQLRLYINDYTPDEDSTFLDFTYASFPGYAPIGIAGQFGSSSLSGHKATVTSSMFVFECDTDTTPQTVYGWYLVDSSATYVVAAGRADTPVTVEFEGDQVRVQITPTMKDENE